VKTKKRTRRHLVLQRLSLIGSRADDPARYGFGYSFFVIYAEPC